MSDERLKELLNQVPAERARPDFTQRVLARLDVPQGASEKGGLSLFGPRWVLAAAACAAILASLGALWLHEAPPDRPLQEAEARQALEAIRAEHARLQREVENLGSPAGNLGIRPEAISDDGMVYLGGNENVDLVVDPGRVAPSPQGVSTASYTNATY
jgi:hypothetical protein